MHSTEGLHGERPRGARGSGRSLVILVLIALRRRADRHVPHARPPEGTAPRGGRAHPAMAPGGPSRRSVPLGAAHDSLARATFSCPFFGPFRLLGSRVFLIGVGASAAALLTWWLLPRLWHLLPTDQVRAHAVGAQESAGQARRRRADLHDPVRRDLPAVQSRSAFARHRAPWVRPPGDDGRLPGRQVKGRLARVPAGRGGLLHLTPRRPGPFARCSPSRSGFPW